MDKNKSDNNIQNKCAERICLAYKTLGLRLHEIENLYAHKQAHVHEFHYSQIRSKAVDITYEDVRLTCLLSEEGICIKLVLFLIDITTINQYIQYCNTIYTYDYLLKGWLTDKCLIAVEKDDDDCMFTFFPQEL